MNQNQGQQYQGGQHQGGDQHKDDQRQCGYCSESRRVAPESRQRDLTAFD
jgi:hypothetical protein